MMHRSVFFMLVFLAAGCGGEGGNAPPPVVQTPDTRSPSVSRSWNELTLNAIRNDFARPTVHARNLFHISAAMYDAWAAYSATSDAYLLGAQIGNFTCPLNALRRLRIFILRARRL